MKKLSFHPLCEIFPVMPDEELSELAADIKTNGLRQPILLLDDLILDGRNRYLACEIAGVKPTFKEFKGDAFALVKSANWHRRHLSEPQRSMVAALLKKESANLPLGHEMSNREAAEMMNVSERSVRHANKVVEKGSAKLQEAVMSGNIGVSKAASVADLPKKDQLATARRSPFDADKIPRDTSGAYISDRDPADKIPQASPEAVAAAVEVSEVYPKPLKFVAHNREEENAFYTWKEEIETKRPAQNGHPNKIKIDLGHAIRLACGAYKRVTGKTLSIKKMDSGQLQRLLESGITLEEFIATGEKAWKSKGFFARQSHQLATFVKHYGNIRNEVTHEDFQRDAGGLRGLAYARSVRTVGSPPQ